MKIALLNTHYFPVEPGGAERSVRILAESLVAAGHEVLVICLASTRRTEMIGGVLVERLPIRNRYLQGSEEAAVAGALKRLLWHARDTFNPAAAKDVQELLKIHRVDVLHTNNIAGFSVAVWTSAKALGIPVVHTTRDFYLLCPKTTLMRGERQCATRCASCRILGAPRLSSSSHVSRFVGISQYMVSKHKEAGAFGAIPASVIYNSYPRQEPLPFPSSGLVVGFLGRLTPAKGLGLLVESIRMMRQADPEAQLRAVIAGVGERSYMESVKAAAADLPIEFLGEVAPRELFARCHVTAVPSLWEEPMGRVVIESMAHGRPVVVTPKGGLPELVSVRTGAVSEDTSVVAFSKALRQVADELENHRQDMLKALAQNVERFSTSRTADDYASVYEAATEAAALPAA